jgi:ABC-type glycerol-3-phosphate transport system permease component
MAEEASRRSRVRRRLGTVAVYALVILALVVLVIPIAWMLSTAFKPLSEVFDIPPHWIPHQPTWANFVKQFNPQLRRIFFNSVVVATGSVFLSTFIGTLTAYAISRFRFRGANLVLMFFMASLGFPIPLLVITIYVMFLKVHLLNTYAALILGHTVITLPVAVWLLKNFFDTLPIEVEEAAFVDGASHLYTLFRIVMPMARPALAATAIFVFVTSWNEFVFGLTFTANNDMRPLPPGIALMFLQDFEAAWSGMMALATMVTLPVLLLFVFFQKAFMRGVTAGAVKG